MKQMELNSGIIYTNDKCIGCNKCISGCAAVGSNVVVKDERLNQYTVMVDPNKCILCGHCVEECVHKARTYRDDTDDFFKALENGESISVLVAPSLLTDYEKDYNKILGYLKHLGVKHIYNSSFGADIMVWVYMNFIHSFGLQGVISQFCPVIVNYLEKYKPKLLDYLMPVQSPMMCTAIYVSDYLGINDKLACISPCIAEKYEISDINTYGKVNYNLTFERLMERINGVDISKYYAEDEVSYGLGALVSSAGGLSDNIKPYIGFNKVLIQTSGYGNIFPYFDHYSEEFSDNGELPFLVDVLSCTNGCDFGTGTSCDVKQRNQVFFSAHRAKESAYKSGNVPTGADYEERLNTLNKRFESFDLSSFVRQYNTISAISTPTLSEEEIEKIFLSMYKDSEEYRHTDCGSCGYATCLEMVYAIGTNVNHKENCINYSKHRIRLEIEKTAQLLEEISHINDELKHADKLKSNFLANMSHEIRTPMNAVIGMAEMALRGGNLPLEEQGYIQQIKASGRSLLAIINDILDFSKIESGKMEINETDYAVMSLINDTVNIVGARIGEKDIALMVEASPDIPYTLLGDDIRIKQVIVNFANNAVKFTQSGFVKISMNYERFEGGVYLSVSVQDTGIGIKEKDMGKLFNSFQRVDSKRNRNIEGTGLGLAISQEFVRLMHGKISVESVYGEGSTFSFKIPQKIVEDIPSITINRSTTILTASIIEDQYLQESFMTSISCFRVKNIECSSLDDLKEAVKKGAEFLFIEFADWDKEKEDYIKLLHAVQTVVIVDSKKDIVTSSYVRKLNRPIYSLSMAAVLNRETGRNFEDHAAEDFRFEAPDAQVLIIDDNAINLTVAKGLLSSLHMNVTTASGAREAIRLIDENQNYDIVFMDHMMPDIDGVEATHILREREGEYYKKLPIIALTANAINNAKEMFLREGMNDFVAKPIEIMDIADKIKKWLPPEKVITLSKDDCCKDESQGVEIPKLEGIDTKAGLALSGSSELYLKILADYCAVIEKKAALIEKYTEEEDIEAYTIEVHALKSASRLIGAIELSEMAAKLEQCGHNKELEPIKSYTAELLRQYRAYLPVLAPLCQAEDINEDEEITTEELIERLDKTYTALDDFDIDAAMEITDGIKRCKLDENNTDFRLRLIEEVTAMEYDAAMAVASAWKNSLEQ